MSEQPDGFYPRLNGQILQSGEHANKIVSLVGKVEMFDGASIQLKCADGVIANVVCEPDTDVVQGSVYEFVGAAGEDGSLQLFVTRDLAADMDLEVYNRMITEVQNNSKFAEYFAAAPFVVKDNA